MIDNSFVSCPKCGNSDIRKIIAVEYSNDNVYHYDGVSEFRCYNCGTRWGRWSKKILDDNQFERRPGG